MTNQVVLIDGSHLLHRISFIESFQKLDRGVIFGFLKSLVNIANLYPSSSAIVCWDRGKSKYRTTIDSSYKEWKSDADNQQQKFLDDYRQNRIQLHNILSLMGILSVILDGYEGDDLLTFFRYNTDYKNYIIFTEDRDLTQLVDERTILYRPISKITVTREDMDNFYPDLNPQYTREHFLLEKAINGDTSDGIDGIFRVGKATIRKILYAYEHGEVHKVLTIPENVDKINKNLGLVDICEAVNYFHSDITQKVLPLINNINTHYLESLQWLDAAHMKSLVPDLDKLLSLNTNKLCMNIRKDSYPVRDYTLGSNLGLFNPVKYSN